MLVKKWVLGWFFIIVSSSEWWCFFHPLCVAYHSLIFYNHPKKNRSLPVNKITHFESKSLKSPTSPKNCPHKNLANHPLIMYAYMNIVGDMDDIIHRWIIWVNLCHFFKKWVVFEKKSPNTSITDTSFYSTFRVRNMSNSCFFTPHRQFDILFKDVILFQVFCWSPEISSFRSWLLKTQLTWWCLRTQETVPDSCPPT